MSHVVFTSLHSSILFVRDPLFAVVPAGTVPGYQGTSVVLRSAITGSRFSKRRYALCVTDGFNSPPPACGSAGVRARS